MPQCPGCGNQTNDVAVWCPVCGYLLKPGEVGAYKSAIRNQPKVVQEYYDRPEGIEILAGLTIISGGFGIIGVIALFAQSLSAGTLSPNWLLALSLMLLLTVVSMVNAWALWNGKGWAWTLNVVVSAIEAAAFAYESIHDYWNVLNLALYLVLLAYLFRPSVRGYFGKFRAPGGRRAPGVAI
jgi:hypothetical protein